MTISSYLMAFTLLMWGVVSLIWIQRRKQTKMDLRSDDKRARWIGLPLFIVIMILMYAPLFDLTLIEWPLYQPTITTGVLGVIINGCGILIAIMARSSLGLNWSDLVAIKEDHELVLDGPYRFIRHPIYVGFDLALIGSAITTGQFAGFILAAMVVVGSLRKMAREEKALRDHFPVAYATYARRVSRAIPGVY